MYDKLVAKVNNIGTSGFVLKTKYDTDKSDLEKKNQYADKDFLILVGLLKKTNYNAKITETEGKIHGFTGLATSAALNAVENKIPDVINLVKEKDYDAKILNIESKYLTTDDCNTFTSQALDPKIKQKELGDKSAIAGFIKTADLDKKSVTLAKKTEFKAEQDKILKLLAFDSSYFRCKSHFEDDGIKII